ncbi:MAG TPA: hypothetical protein VJ914_17315 [Pseudonocardiaceae bacterium]|nr:hypothetical protein [Pseudonocardiaceae bacterium]
MVRWRYSRFSRATGSSSARDGHVMDTWNPADWQLWRERWEGAFVVRATALLFAFGALVAAGAVAR